MTYSVFLAAPAERQLRSFPSVVQKRLVKRMKALQNDPRSTGVKKLAGKDDLYRIREDNPELGVGSRNRILWVPSRYTHSASLSSGGPTYT